VRSCTFAGLVGTNYTLSASATGLTTATSSSFSPTSSGGTQLVFTTQPVGGTHGATMSSVAVSVENASGTVITTSTASITIALGSGSGRLSGTLTLNAVNGVATFSGLSISRSGSGDTLVVTSSGLTSATSTAFTEL